MVALVLVCGIWAGALSPQGRRGAIPLLGMAGLLFALAMFFLTFCKRLSFIDMLLVRYVGDDSCLLGGFESNDLALSYMCIIAAAVAALRSKLTRPLPRHDQGDI